MREFGRRRREENAHFKSIVQACRDAGGVVEERVRELLDEERWQSDAQLAAMIGERISARLPANLQKDDIERMWRFEQYFFSLPVLAVEVTDGLVNLAYRNGLGQNYSVEDIKRLFEAAIHRPHPEAKVEWVIEAEPEKSNQETS